MAEQKVAFRIISSSGEFDVAANGVPLVPLPGRMSSITRFDVEEYVKWARPVYPKEDWTDVIPVDVLEIGMWWKNSHGQELYEGPDKVYRKRLADGQREVFASQEQP